MVLVRWGSGPRNRMADWLAEMEAGGLRQLKELGLGLAQVLIDSLVGRSGTGPGWFGGFCCYGKLTY